MKPAIAAVPQPIEKPARKSRWTKADFELIRALRAIVSEFAKGKPIFQRRSELRTLAHQAVDKFFDAKVVGQ